MQNKKKLLNKNVSRIFINKFKLKILKQKYKNIIILI